MGTIQSGIARKLLPAWNYTDEDLTLKRTAATRLLGQLAILEVRVESSWPRYLLIDSETYLLTRACLHLDIETYYTVAADLLKIVARMFPDSIGRSEFEREPCYRTIMTIRNQLIRHAYDKPDGDPHNGFAFCSGQGMRLKGGGPFRNSEQRFEDPGHIKNFAALRSLFDRCEIPRVELSEELRKVLGPRREPELLQRLTVWIRQRKQRFLEMWRRFNVSNRRESIVILNPKPVVVHFFS